MAKISKKIKTFISIGDYSSIVMMYSQVVEGRKVEEEVAGL